MDPTMMSVFGVGVSMAAILVVGLRSLRAEVTAVETRLGKRIDDSKSELRTEINAVETRLGKRIDDTKTELRTEINAVETRLGTEINAVETRLGKRIDGLDSRVNGLDQRLTLLKGALSAVFRPLRRSGLPDPTPDEAPA